MVRDDRLVDSRGGAGWGGSLIDVDILGHIFEQSIADAESEINTRVFRLFNLTAEEAALLMREVEH